MSSQPDRRRQQRGYAAAWAASFMVAILVLGAGAVTPIHAGVNVAPPDIDLEKLVNNVDADTPTGPLVAVGSTVTFT